MQGDRKMKHKPLIFEYSQITDYIYIGTNMCCQTHFNKSLLLKGIKADISLEEIKLDQPYGVDYYLWLPTKDHSPPSLKQLEVGTAFLKELHRQKIKCYIHCERGHGRAPTLVAAYLVTTGKDMSQALTTIKKQRSDIHPNKKQIAMLRRFERKQKEVRT